MNKTANPNIIQTPENRDGYLKITEIFLSLQGEARDSGRPTTFIRLTGCPLRCSYCDSEYAFFGGEWYSFDAILAAVEANGVKYVCVTGGEPLAQKRCVKLLELLCDAGLDVSLETSGAIDISNVDTRVSKVVDLKTPDSGESQRNLWSNLEHIKANDQIKFVLNSRADYDWAVTQLHEYSLPDLAEVLFSPVWSALKPVELADWIIADRLPVRFQLQLHKILWNDEPGR
ncbi:MAG: 7-carboxy-7-deazaguanine synthase QueE [Xanthomonadales bacterium]|nr:7-carboxy-7-deazaguanine synthase QueE [Xanthomonadales bacterium]